MVVDDDDLGEGAVPAGGRIKRVAQATALLAVLRCSSRAQEGQSEPQVINSDPRIEALAEQAIGFARAEREDGEALAALRRSGGRRLKPRLTSAAAFVRFGGAAAEDRTADRANRLLLAAANDVPVEPITADRDKWFGQIEALMAVPVEEAFRSLQQMQPGLVGLEAQVRAFSSEIRRRDGGALSGADEQVLWNEVLAGLKPLLGRDAQEADALLRTRTAHNVARLHLAKVAGLIDEIEYE